MAKSSVLTDVLATLQKEESTLQAQLGKVRDAMAALAGVPQSYKRKQAVRKAKTVVRNVRTMTAAQRKAVSQRMKAYWAAQKKAKS